MTLGFITAIAGMGFHAPAVLIVSFIPMLLIAAAYNYMNKADPDCGTSFTWVTRALGPRLGWLTGWTIVAADVLVMATLAYIAAVYSFLLFGLDGASTNLLDISIVAAVWIVVMTWICYIGIEISARTQFVLLGIEIFTLALFAVVALWKVYVTGTPDSVARRPQLVLPVQDARRHHRPGRRGAARASSSTGAGTAASASTRSPKTPPTGPGKAAVMSTILLVLIYVVVAASAQAFAGPGVPLRKLRRRARRPRGQRPRLAAGQTADHHRADLGLGVDPDDDPADGADDALDGALRLDPEGLRANPSPLPDARTSRPWRWAASR